MQTNSTPESLDQRLLSLADLIEGCDAELRQHWKEQRPGYQCLLEEQEAWELLQEHAPAISRALSAIAMRLNRAAIGMHERKDFSTL